METLSLRRVPWEDWKEWMEIYEVIYAGDGGNIQIAREILRRWSIRGFVPSAVESTVWLAYSLEEETEDEDLCRRNLALSLTRFVNSLVDQSQKSFYARPVKQIAAELGIPEWIVDMRHESTHNLIPGLQALRCAADFSIQWLREKYWLEQITLRKEFEEKIDGALETYVTLVENILVSKNADGELGEKIDNVLRTLETSLSHGVLLGFVCPRIFQKRRFFLIRDKPADQSIEEFFRHLCAVWEDFFSRYREIPTFADNLLINAARGFAENPSIAQYGMWVKHFLGKFEYGVNLLKKAFFILSRDSDPRTVDTTMALLEHLHSIVPIEPEALSLTISRMKERQDGSIWSPRFLDPDTLRGNRSKVKSLQWQLRNQAHLEDLRIIDSNVVPDEQKILARLRAEMIATNL